MPTNPPALPPSTLKHPGAVLERWLTREGRSQTWLADRIDVSRKHINRIVNGQARYSPELAIKLGRVTDLSARQWMHLQADYDLVCAMQAARQAGPCKGSS